MTDYLWVYILSGIALTSLMIFIISFPKDHFFIKKLKLKKTNYLLNFIFLFISISDIGLIIYLFILLKNQIGVLS